jgi:hypothetical protein
MEIDRAQVFCANILICGLGIAFLWGCAPRFNDSASNKHQPEMNSEAIYAAGTDGQAYSSCVLAQAAIYAADSKDSNISAGDLADASIATCAVLLNRLESVIGKDRLVVAGDIAAFARADSSAHVTAQEIQAKSRAQALAIVIDTRRNSPAAK